MGSVGYVDRNVDPRCDQHGRVELIASVCVREDAVYPPGIRHDHGRIAGAKFLACIPECLDEYGGVRLRTRHISVEIFGCEPFVGARPILCVGCGAEASLEMLQNSLPLALPANAVDEIAKALLDGGFYRAGTVKTPSAIELEHRVSPRCRRLSACYGAHRSVVGDGSIAETLEPDGRPPRQIHRQLKFSADRLNVAAQCR